MKQAEESGGYRAEAFISAGPERRRSHTDRLKASQPGKRCHPLRWSFVRQQPNLPTANKELKNYGGQF
jgi:hypothetical protein